jgi:hypothetical protein
VRKIYGGPENRSFAPFHTHYHPSKEQWSAGKTFNIRIREVRGLIIDELCIEVLLFTNQNLLSKN